MDDIVLNEHHKEEFPPAHTAEHLLNQTMIRLFGCDRSYNAHIERKKSKMSFHLKQKPSRQEEKQIDLAEVSAQTMSKRSYMKKWRNLTDEEADEELRQIALERQLLESSYFNPGGEPPNNPEQNQQEEQTPEQEEPQEEELTE